MTQTLTNLAVGRTYTLSFYYDFYSIVQASSCQLSISMGTFVIYNRILTSVDNPGPYNWIGPESATYTPTSSDTTLNFAYTCVTSGTQANTYSYIFIDQLFFTYA